MTVNYNRVISFYSFEIIFLLNCFCLFFLRTWRWLIFTIFKYISKYYCLLSPRDIRTFIRYFRNNELFCMFNHATQVDASIINFHLLLMKKHERVKMFFLLDTWSLLRPQSTKRLNVLWFSLLDMHKHTNTSTHNPRPPYK